MVNDLADELAQAAEADVFNPDARMAARSIFEAQERVFKLVPRILEALRHSVPTDVAERNAVVAYLRWQAESAAEAAERKEIPTTVWWALNFAASTIEAGAHSSETETAALSAMPDPLAMARAMQALAETQWMLERIDRSRSTCFSDVRERIVANRKVLRAIAPATLEVNRATD